MDLNRLKKYLLAGLLLVLVLLIPLSAPASPVSTEVGLISEDQYAYCELTRSASPASALPAVKQQTLRLDGNVPLIYEASTSRWINFLKDISVFLSLVTILSVSVWNWIRGIDYGNRHLP